MLNLHNLKSTKGSRKKSKRIGRGGKRGSYSGRGMKGQKARSGGKKGLQLKGLKKMIQSIPKKRGFKSMHPKLEIVNIKQLSVKFKDDDIITPEILLKEKLVSKIKNGVKILGNGELKKKLIIKGCAISKFAKDKIEKAGGKVE
ncbi:50S ribosomal protein L15 [Candidatus Kuenenbacteria bacterium HGW-Kuenenbacteria-1]|uniref:Large ribosomal subunit protein uL15 n=1 Tax=Candidatus Kuenenbacteria bacterium HGW-Kuenenbacteria-1 TaxID=2013812 RepID=A0A2N1UNE8_9BACT|nr:MAG: 50S ribosomal protein L15 [Candidatus Kuenenbacteria bacterium HGW-Kuenenbacteria-1]